MGTLKEQLCSLAAGLEHLILNAALCCIAHFPDSMNKAVA